MLSIDKEFNEAKSTDRTVLNQKIDGSFMRVVIGKTCHDSFTASAIERAYSKLELGRSYVAEPSSMLSPELLNQTRYL